ncbi:MAG: hypothetical protein EBR40_00290 [Proteobacteria bacterium]|nr:hypothetical protein [Pseudomonadota bacterium]
MMFSTLPKRTVLLGGTALLLLILLVTRWCSDWGLVTIHVKDAPLAKVTASIARQGHVTMETSLDPSTKVSMDADRVTVAEAVDQLAQITDSSWRGGIVTAPTKLAVSECISKLRAGPDPEGWSVFYYPLSPMMSPDETVMDPRSLLWNVQGPDREVRKLLDEAAQKSGAMIVMPKDWSATAPRLPGTAATGSAVHELVKLVRGRDLSFFYLTARERRRWEEGPQEASAPPPSSISRPAPNPEWMDQRITARINTLPIPKQAEAKKEYEAAKAFRESVKSLSPEERRQKMRERMADPEFVDKMAERMLLRDSRRTAQQRISRAVNYLKRKASVQATQPH